MEQPSRFLIIQTAFIGDVILATALIEQLHAAFPTAIIDFMLRKGNESLLKDHPIVNEVLVWNKKQAKYGSLFDLLKKVRRRKYDVVINLQRFGATGLFTALSKAKKTAGFDKNPFSRFYTHTAEHRLETGVHEIDRNAGVIRWLTDSKSKRPKLYPAAADYDLVRPYQKQPYICLAPTSVWFTKQYPREKWVDLLLNLPSGYVVYLLGAPSDAAACDWIIEQAGSAAEMHSLAGKLSLLASAALMQGAVMNYVNDSAPMHLASAMNAPTTAIFCSTEPEFGFGPLAEQSHVVEIQEKLECRPCGLHGYKKCPLGHFNCAHGIQTEQLLAVLPA
ncbi:glycosyltransferase family 9 protein [Tellurirhabdus bombi]|uniref:glycosyltransferase family 9 protein n=1 Tax=Tellurirhabdus bombi TaxID=2907205 RepID=UPI001F1C95D4|nr:glycosyltransferase family 9 protein [Tellurirhabdus bombi]